MNKKREPGLKRFKLAVQKNRAIVFTFAALIAIVFQYMGAIPGTFLTAVRVIMAANVSALLFYLIYRKYWRINLDPLWLLFDAAMITYGVYLTGGIESPWYPWYLANVSGAAFVMGMGWAVIIASLDTVLFLGMLLYLGHVQVGDQAFFSSLALMICLFGSTIFFLRGATELQKKQRQVKQLKENESRKVAELTRLTTELDTRTRELSDANLKISQADRMKSQFLANMSHELRTPLNSIIGFSDILLSRLGDELSEKYMKFLSNINTSGQHLLGIINDLLDLSKIEAGRMEVNPEKFPLENIIQGVCTIMKGVATKRGIQFEVNIADNLPPLEADSIKIKQILYNLISNAVKFSPDQSTITISADLLEAEKSPLGEQSIQFAVVDRGIGIAPENHERVFQEFQQVDNSSTRQFQGTGLGLALVKRFVELHNGQIRLESDHGKGSTFTVILPRRFILNRPTPDQVQPIVASDNTPRVLVVEDDLSSYEAISRELAVAHYVPVRARFGEEAIKLAHSVQPVAITLDIILPDIDGWDVLKKLKQDPDTCDIPVIIISMLGNRELGMALGADDYFVKPLDGSRLLRRLSEIVPRDSVRHPRILIIDDEQDVHDMFDEMLASSGYLVDHAITGKEGIAKCFETPPSLIVLDLMMEGMDGFEVAAFLKSNPKTRYLPILILTGKDLDAGDRKRLTGKISALVEKGKTSPSQLVQTIKSLVRRHAKEENHDATT